MTSLYLARAYQHSFDSAPNVTLALTGGSLNALGDAVAQLSERITTRNGHERHEYDLARTLRFFCFGLAISPLLGRWNAFLEHRFPLRSAIGSSKVNPKALTKRVLCDQAIMAPIGLAAFIGAMGTMEGRNLQQIGQKYSDIYKPALLTNWKVWPIAQLINFRFMPLPYRVPFQSSCGVFWTLYLSLINAKEDKKQDRETEIRKTLRDN